TRAATGWGKGGAASAATRSMSLLIKALKGTGPEPGNDVIPIGWKEIPIPRSSNARTRRPAPAAQYLAFSKPRLRVVLVRVGNKSLKGCGVGGRPLPKFSNLLPAPEGAVAAGASRYIDWSIVRKIEICMLARRLRPTPGPNSLNFREPPAPGAGLADC